MEKKKKPIQENLDEGDDLGLGSLEDQKEKITERFFDACKNGSVEAIKKYLGNEILDPLELDSSGWSALQWAVVNNHPEVVKVLYPKIKELEALQEKTKKDKEAEQNFAHELSEFDEAFKKPLNPADNGKYTPLHWSAYKGYDIISSILIKMGCDPMQVDSYGDNALHQAAAGNHYDTFKLFMGLGIDLDYKNSRSHKAIDLTTNKKIEELINKILKAKECCLCHKIFDFDNKRYLCSIKEDIICKNCSRIDYYFPTEDSQAKDIRDCRCKDCQDEIIKAENDLQEAILSNNLETLSTQFAESKKYKIDLHLFKEATLNEDRLKREKEIREHLDSLKVVENHKTILKQVDELDKKLKSAEDNNVQLDKNLVQRAKDEKLRLLSEKELRQFLSNVTIEMASQENLDNLTNLVDTADKYKVAEEYVSKGKDLKEKFILNLDAKDIMAKLKDYPLREYPVVEVVDPKKKSKYYSFNYIYIFLNRKRSPTTKKKEEEEEGTPIPDPRMGQRLKCFNRKSRKYEKICRYVSRIGI